MSNEPQVTSWKGGGSGCYVTSAPNPKILLGEKAKAPRVRRRPILPGAKGERFLDEGLTQGGWWSGVGRQTRSR